MELFGLVACLGVLAAPVVLFLILRSGAKQQAEAERQYSLRCFEYWEGDPEIYRCDWTLDFATMRLEIKHVWFEPGHDETPEHYLVRRKEGAAWQTMPTPETWRHLLECAHEDTREAMLPFLKEQAEETIKFLGERPRWTDMREDVAAAVEPHYQRFVAHWRGP